MRVLSNVVFYAPFMYFSIVIKRNISVTSRLRAMPPTTMLFIHSAQSSTPHGEPASLDMDTAITLMVNAILILNPIILQMLDVLATQILCFSGL